MHGVRQKSKSITDLVDNYLTALERKDLSATYLYTIKGRLERFVASYGDWLACDMSRDVLEEWLEDLKLSAVSVNHFRAALIQLFNRALEMGIVEKNPVAGISKKKVPSREIGILNPRQVAALLENAPAEILAGLAIAFFAGVRRAELCRMDWSEIDFEQGLIEIKASKSKTAARRLIKIHECLREWLLRIRQHEGNIMPSEMIWRTRLAEAMNASGLKEWPHNAPRHSYASYHLAKFQDAAALALEMGHGSTKTLFEHYRALVTPAAAESYWSIMPADFGTITLHDKKPS